MPGGGGEAPGWGAAGGGPGGSAATPWCYPGTVGGRSEDAPGPPGQPPPRRGKVQGHSRLEQRKWLNIVSTVVKTKILSNLFRICVTV